MVNYYHKVQSINSSRIKGALQNKNERYSANRSFKEFDFILYQNQLYNAI